MAVICNPTMWPPNTIGSEFAQSHKSLKHLGTLASVLKQVCTGANGTNARFEASESLLGALLYVQLEETFSRWLCETTDIKYASLSPEWTIPG